MEARPGGVHSRGSESIPETGKPFELSRAQQSFLRRALTLTAEGRLRFPESLFSAPKKSGKTTLAAMITIYLITCLGGTYAEAYCVANDFEQAASRVFQAVARIIRVKSAATRLGKDHRQQD